MTNKQRFIDIFNRNIGREGAEDLLDYLCSDACDFFTAPASTRYHGAHEGGLCEHSLNVYDCLVDLLERKRVSEIYGLHYSDETVAIVALLHDLCKINFYQVSTRNVKDETGRWVQVPYYSIEDSLPYGHGEKSVYIASGYMKLTREEAFAIRYHMGFSEAGPEGGKTVGRALAMFPLALFLNEADMEASFLLEERSDQ